MAQSRTAEYVVKKLPALPERLRNDATGNPDQTRAFPPPTNMRNRIFPRILSILTHLTSCSRYHERSSLALGLQFLDCGSRSSCPQSPSTPQIQRTTSNCTSVYHWKLERCRTCYGVPEYWQDIVPRKSG